jgi:diguanylate cyclase (GGDEF)-like protein/PAS domain S-box-containing protein
VTRTLPLGLARLWPYVVAGVALAVALVAAVAVARQYELADDQRRGQLALLEMRGEIAGGRLATLDLSVPVELAGDAQIARELRSAQEARTDRNAVHEALQRAAERAGEISEETRREANASAVYAAAAGAFLVAGLLWVLLAGRRRAAVEAAETRGVRRSERWFKELVQHSSDAILVTGRTGEIRYATPSIERIVGHPSDELMGRSLLDLAPGGDLEAVAATLSEVGGSPRSEEWRLLHRDGTSVPVEALLARWGEDDEGYGVLLNLRDVRERKALEDQLRHRAFHDELTGLANRALFEDRLTHALARARRHGGRVAVLFLDLDDFKPVNDALGHAAGDTLLKEVARRLAECLRASDTGARVGGDEFAVLLEDPSLPDDIDDVAGRLLDWMRRPLEVNERELFPSASIGVAVDDGGTTTATDLLRDADVAMYAAKRSGKGRVARFEPTMRTVAVERLHLRADLERAVERGELTLLYQPIVQLDSGTVISVEALARWQHPLRGLLDPDSFIPLAEESGLIVPIGRHLLRRACREAAGWRDEAGLPSEVSVSVNLSARQLHHPELVADVGAALADSELSPARLQLEVTENVLIDDAALAVEQLKELRALGIRIALDDFGTGYSSLGYVRRFPLDELKIDRSFVDRIAQADGDSALVSTIATLAEQLGLRLVAEGIEREEQVAALQMLHCELGQGFLFARPLESEALAALLSNGSAMSRRPREGADRAGPAAPA